ncbi:MAG: acetyl-CoA carboxylase carboxyltransferase subunit beta [Candidatus Hydrogenedentes bacterium]|nr:acetyl-CoA carboxylase carboxyltransferase subunit beta [Candidatus Hydrogenedentota bacterium]
MPFLNRRRFVSIVGRRSSLPDGLWMKCPGCKQAVYRAEVEQNQQVCPRCAYHHRIGAMARIAILVDEGSFEERHQEVQTLDPLEFKVGEATYLEKVEKAKSNAQLSEALVVGYARIEESRTVLGVMDPFFMMASMGSAVGERFCRAARDAITERLPLVVIAASGGARMQEGILSLMQMAKTAEAVRRLNEAAIPYITVLTDPTTGGVYASFAALGDITLAEPGALIGFAGPRLIEGALKVKLPEGFQTAEYQYNNGFIDQIVKRSELRPTLGKLLRYLRPQ